MGAAAASLLVSAVTCKLLVSRSSLAFRLCSRLTLAVRPYVCSIAHICHQQAHPTRSYELILKKLPILRG